MSPALKGCCITPEYFSNKGSFCRSAHHPVSEKHTAPSDSCSIVGAISAQNIATGKQGSSAETPLDSWDQENTTSKKKNQKNPRPNCFAMAVLFKHHAANPAGNSICFVASTASEFKCPWGKKIKTCKDLRRQWWLGRAAPGAGDQAGEYFSL